MMMQFRESCAPLCTGTQFTKDSTETSCIQFELQQPIFGMIKHQFKTYERISTRTIFKDKLQT